MIDLPRDRARKAREYSRTWGSKEKDAIKGLPVDVRTMGLGQAVALCKRRRGGYDRLAEDLAKWLLKDGPQKPLGAGDGSALALLDLIVEADDANYLAAEAEALAFLDAMKLFGGL